MRILQFYVSGKQGAKAQSPQGIIKRWRDRILKQLGHQKLLEDVSIRPDISGGYIQAVVTNPSRVNAVLEGDLRDYIQGFVPRPDTTEVQVREWDLDELLEEQGLSARLSQDNERLLRQRNAERERCQEKVEELEKRCEERIANAAALKGSEVTAELVTEHNKALHRLRRTYEEGITSLKIHYEKAQDEKVREYKRRLQELQREVQTHQATVRSLEAKLEEPQRTLKEAEPKDDLIKSDEPPRDYETLHALAAKEGKKLQPYEAIFGVLRKATPENYMQALEGTGISSLVDEAPTITLYVVANVNEGTYTIPLPQVQSNRRGWMDTTRLVGNSIAEAIPVTARARTRYHDLILNATDAVDYTQLAYDIGKQLEENGVFEALGIKVQAKIVEAEQ